jgi:ankyrin repeat protein
LGLYAQKPASDSSGARAAPDEGAVTLADLDRWLREGADLDAELGNAVIADDLRRVGHLLAKGARIDARDAQGYPPIVHAARRSHADLVELLAQRGADVNAADRDGWTALMFAAWRDNAAIIATLAAQRVELEPRNPIGLTALGIAAQGGNGAAGKALIVAGANVSAALGAGGYTPLMLAVTGGSLEAVDALIKKGADVNAPNAGGVTALMIAAAKDAIEIAERLIEAGANVTARSDDGRTALGIAHEQENDVFIKLLERAAAKGQPGPGKVPALNGART